MMDLGDQTVVYLDVNALTQPRVTGIGRYCLELTQALRTYPWDDDYIWKPVVKLSRLKHFPRVAQKLGDLPRIFAWDSLWENRPEIYHGLDFRVPRFSLGGRRLKKIVTIHDLIFLEERFNSPEFVAKAKVNFENTVIGAEPDLFICVSEYTRQHFARHYPQLKDRMRVVHLGGDHQVGLRDSLGEGAVNATGRTAELPERYILFLGTLEFRKNALMVVKAFEQLATRDSTLHLVMAGSPGYRGDEVLAAIANSPFEKRILRFNYVSEPLIDTLYSRAKAFVFPSLFEGFGIPILEAMRHGCPVVTSAHLATAEVAGSAAILVDPESVDSVVNGVESLLRDEALLISLQQRGLVRSHEFTWAKTASETVRLYREVLAE